MLKLQNNNRPEPVEALMLVMMTFFGILFLSMITASIFFGETAIKENSASIGFLFLTSRILFLIVPLYYSKQKGFPLTEVFRLRKVSAHTLFMAILLGISITILAEEVSSLIQMLVPLPESFKELNKQHTEFVLGNWHIYFLLSVVLIPIVEEFMFRGFLQTTLEARGNPSRAVVLTSVTWALIYMDPYSAIPILFMGIFIGYLAWQSRSIIPSIIAHAIQALVGMFLILPENNFWAESMKMAGHVHPILLILAIGGLYISINKLTPQRR